MFNNDNAYPYLEEVNNGILREFALANELITPTVLDVGCGQGTLGAEITDRGYEVSGVELSEFAAERAQRRVAHVIRADLTDESAVRKELGHQQFDNIVFADVLEHVYDPLSVLTSYLEYLEPGGRVLISVPNCVNWQMRLAVLCGRFDYQDTGVRDRTHIRFFTVKTAKEMVRRAGLEVRTIGHTPLLVRSLLPVAKRLLARPAESDGSSDPRAIIDSRAYQLYLRYGWPVEHLIASVRRQLFAFQIVLVAARPGVA